jgi:hypothetical protein
VAKPEGSAGSAQVAAAAKPSATSIEQSALVGFVGSAAAVQRPTTDDMIEDFFLTFEDSVRRIDPDYLTTLCQFWKIDYLPFTNGTNELTDAEGCMNEIIDTMIVKSTFC